jgi:hypothetical protein
VDLFHAFVDFGLDAEWLLSWLFLLVRVELVSASEGGLVDPVSG